MFDFWDREPENELEKERKMLFILQQARQLGPNLSLKITCPCGQDETIALACRCFYCGVMFCRQCAKRHFEGETHG